MPIIYNETNQTFHLFSSDTSYAFKVINSGHLVHLYWGKKIRNIDVQSIFNMMELQYFTPSPVPVDIPISLDSLPQEFPTCGTSDFRNPILEARMADGSSTCVLKYLTHTIVKGKPEITDLPSTYVENEDEATTLIVSLLDHLTGLNIDMYYTVFENLDVITRRCVIKNKGIVDISLKRALSCSVDMHNREFDMIHLTGFWARERHIKRTRLTNASICIDSKRGASGHHQNPFIALLDPYANENSGDVYAFNLVYSGNFLAQCEVDQFDQTRINIGINPFDFSWLLKPEEEFSTPEVVMVYSSQGLSKMSKTFHDLYRQRLCRGEYRDKPRPVLLNNWEATYFNFDEPTLDNLASSAQDLGIELFVLDDGWFGKRNNDDSSLGDWYVDKMKLPNGLDTLGKKINERNMKFGLWFEPEMVSPDSNLYKEHPDWCLQVSGRTCSLGRKQLILDISRQDVREKVLKMMTDILDNAPIEYVKWDMNRNMSEVGSLLLPPERQRETSHRYILGLYKMMDYLTNRYPHILFEGCACGGGRFDPGILYYMPQIWTSDNTDAVERMKIQYGTSLVYPPITMGGHVSAVPNHQVYRTTSLETRAHVAMFGNFGYELDLTALTESERKSTKKHIEIYHCVKDIFQFGDFYRLIDPFETNEAAWMSVTKDKSRAVVSYFEVLAVPTPPITRLKLKGLDESSDYKIVETSQVIGGDTLMHVGINMPILQGDFRSMLLRLERI